MLRFTIFYIVHFLTLFIACQSDKKKQQSLLQTENTSLLVLKNFNPESQTPLLGGRLFGINKEFFLEITDYNNILKINYSDFSGKLDTIRIQHTNQIMMATLNQSALLQETFYLKVGDTLVVDFSDLTQVKATYLNENPTLKIVQKIIPKDSLLFIPSFLLSKELAEKQKFIKEQYDLNIKAKQQQWNLGYQNQQIDSTVYNLQKAKWHFAEQTKNIDVSQPLEKGFIGLEEYQIYLQNYTEKKFQIQDIQLKNGGHFDYLTAFKKVIKSSDYEQDMKRYLLFYYLQKISDLYPHTDFVDCLTDFEEKVNDTTLVAYLKNKYLVDLEQLKNESENVHLIDYHKQTTTLSKLLETNQGKVVYVDFWASWCVPCRKQMPFSKKLHHEYGDKVIFVYISIDTDFDKWQRAVTEEQLAIDGNNLFAVNYPKANFYKELNLRSIPRYLLFNKQGKLVHKNAPQPDSQTIKKELDKLIK